MRFKNVPDGIILMSLVFICHMFASCSGGRNTSPVFSSETEESASEDTLYTVADTLNIVEDTPISASVDELFDDFFFNFASDERFQAGRIAFPLTLNEEDDERQLTHDEWQEYNRFGTQDFYNVIYEREEDINIQKDTTINKVSVDWIYMNEHYVEKFNFLRIDGIWKLHSIDKQTISSIPNGHFLKFYTSFACDSVLQRQSIEEPLRFILTSEDGLDKPETEELTIDDWYNLRNDLPSFSDAIVNIDYGQPCISENKKILLIEGISNGLLLKFKFHRTGDTWKLTEIEN